MSKRILVDITHPAHVHFFRNAITRWRERGHQVFITARIKDIAIDLLDRYGLEHLDLSAARSGLVGLALELAERDLRLARVVRKVRPHVMTSIAGVYIAMVGRLLGVPSVAFQDTENAVVSNRLTFPFATVVVTPDCYEAAVPRHKHLTYPGYHELAYVHPGRFTPDPAALGLFGLEPGQDFILMRLVGWKAVHDLTDTGFGALEPVVERLERYGRVLISSERDLPPGLSDRRLTDHLDQVIHLQYYARLLVGESATMASECACLGTPAVFVSTSTRGYTNEQGRRYGLVFTYSDPGTGQAQALAQAESILSGEVPRKEWRERARRMLADKIDVTDFMVEVVERYARN
ncbi:MAG: DUF354 domain-containing protein [Proteobacteria bacterium]|nr:DUF354 domain-containing protein [Pseudomonadota bacterium]